MTNANQGSLEMLTVALEMEQKGKAFYEKTLTTCKNPLGAEIFRTLKKDEDVHVDRIKAIYEGLTGNQGWTNAWVNARNDHEELTAVFRALAAKHGANIKAQTGDLEALAIGIDFEQKSVAFYEEHLLRATDPIERAFLEKMVIEEKGHRDVLKDMKFYLEDPASWFREQERSGYDGA